MSDDLTFCYHNKCKNKKCMRHSSNIKIHYRPHSFAFFTECRYWDRPMEYFSASKAEEEKE